MCSPAEGCDIVFSWSYLIIKCSLQAKSAFSIQHFHPVLLLSSLLHALLVTEILLLKVGFAPGKYIILKSVDIC